MEKINIAELLKDCPKGTKLYSPLCGECIFDHLNYGTIICKKQNTQEIAFTSEGYYMLPVFDDCECMIFPSKDQRDWSKFQRPFKDGDIVVSEKGDIHLLRTSNSSYCAFREQWENKFDCTITTSIKVVRLATEEEKQKLFQVIKENGYKWNPEYKILEKLKKEYPKTYEECCEVLELEDDEIYINVNITNIEILENKKFGTFIRLIRCRNAYWKIAGEEMRLGKSWEPDFNSGHFTPAIIFQHGFIQKVEVRYRNTILAFPTTEMRNDFSEHFKKDIEQCKEFL